MLSETNELRKDKWCMVPLMQNLKESSLWKARVERWLPGSWVKQKVSECKIQPSEKS